MTETEASIIPPYHQDTELKGELTSQLESAAEELDLNVHTVAPPASFPYFHAYIYAMVCMKTGACSRINIVH